MVGVSISRPKNSICWDGLTTNFFIFLTKSRCRSGKINVCLLIKIYSNVFPIRKILPRYVSRWILICLNRVIDTFKSFENILGATPNPKQSQKNSQLSSTVVLTNRYLLDIYCRDNYFPREPSILKSFYAISLLRAFKFMRGQFPQYFILTRRILFRK